MRVLFRSTGRPTRQASQALSRKILRVARDVFFADGFGRSTAERIAAKAGISKRTLYARYGNKQLLFEAAILMEIEDRLSFLEQHVPEHGDVRLELRSEEHTSELQSLMRISYDVFCLKQKIYVSYTPYFVYTLYTTQQTYRSRR